jgi:hypothetical protein
MLVVLKVRQPLGSLPGGFFHIFIDRQSGRTSAPRRPHRTHHSGSE